MGDIGKIADNLKQSVDKDYISFKENASTKEEKKQIEKDYKEMQKIVKELKKIDKKDSKNSNIDDFWESHSFPALEEPISSEPPFDDSPFDDKGAQDLQKEKSDIDDLIKSIDEKLEELKKEEK
jgi:Skp family chaperone for outer membrane proteins